MVKKVNRISSQKEFEEVKRRGRLVSGGWWSWLVLNDGGAGKKVGVVVSKKISKKAVDRNRIKRLVTEGVRKSLELVPEGSRIVFLIKRAVLGKGAEEIEKEVKKMI